MPNINKIIENFPKVKVLIVGDVMLDQYLWGNVNRISPEAPVPIVNINKTSLVLGGAANVAANVVGLGAKPFLIGISGEDTEAELLSELLKTEGISTEYLIKLKERRTTIKTRLVAHNQHVVRFDQETVNPLNEEDAIKILKNIEDVIDKVSIIIISDYAKGLLTEFILSHLITLGKEHHKFIFVDPKGKDFSKYTGANILTPNRREAAEATNIEENGQDLIDQAGEMLLRNLSLDALLITQGEKGLTLLQKGKDVFHLKALARTVYDVTGAGDTVIASFAVAVGAGADYIEASKIANISAGLVVEQLGTTAITMEMLQKSVQNQEL